MIEFLNAVKDNADMVTVSGLSAAHTIYLNGGNVLLLDKNSRSSDLARHAAADQPLQTSSAAIQQRRLRALMLH